jgi:hypothetical protein
MFLANNLAYSRWTPAALMVVVALSALPLSVQAQTIPSDAKAIYTVALTDLANWFELGTSSLNGVLRPAESLNFVDQPNCAFQISDSKFNTFHALCMCNGPCLFVVPKASTELHQAVPRDGTRSSCITSLSEVCIRNYFVTTGGRFTSKAGFVKTPVVRKMPPSCNCASFKIFSCDCPLKGEAHLCPL